MANVVSLLELKTSTDAAIAQKCYDHGEPFGTICSRLAIHFGRELHMTDDAWRFTPAAQVLPNGEDPRDPGVANALLARGYFVLFEGKSFWHYTEHWQDRPRYLVQLSNIEGRDEWISALPYFRALHRKVASATNERTAVFCLVPPGSLTGESCIADTTPFHRTNTSICFLVGMANSFTFDWCARQLVCSNFSGYIRDRVSLPRTVSRLLLAHLSLRLTCNHAGYAPLWTEQLGDTWREPKPKHTWPVLDGDDARWAVRAAIDAVVADAYGLTRDQYAHILSTFSHKSFPKAPELCLACFDELEAIGLEAFTKKHDPYWDIPLNENLPKPVIELPEVRSVMSDGGSEGAEVRGQRAEGRGQRSDVRGQKAEVSESKGKRRGRKARGGEVREGAADYGPLFANAGKEEEAEK